MWTTLMPFLTILATSVVAAAEEGTCENPSSASSSALLYVSLLFAFPTVFWLVAYLIPQLHMAFGSIPNLKEKYNAEWALVTGGGSGIGKALAFKLASQGLNVVIVSLDDKFLKETMEALKEHYPKQQFRSVGCTFSPGVDYMKQIDEATKDIDVPIIFNNAGFIVTGFLDQAPIGKLLANIECNATAGVNVAHFFVKKLVSSKKKGCIVFTSSVAGFIPAPFAAMYAATKAFVSQFAACLHIEVASLGIDVVAVHPSPVASNFYQNLDHKVEMIEAAAKSAVPPSELPDDIFRSIGRAALRDLGGLAWSSRMGTFWVPYNCFTRIFAIAAPFMEDWKQHNKNR
ncbi:oxooacyl-coA reductase let-767 [Seminavis robusta]|uniref:Oxooacyl-coA reductase let-767 n=1 Tax=Seminavis robusta TaxID=568900 RepID=A0A9N8D761_9STRA|nr:oxooacyl-coA reductase let-767 [Seminavis robusta]|eukprot:Sro23_g016020.1 oxooacyl-coA reductase let-767 (344) ;mRNA; r:133519-134668